MEDKYTIGEKEYTREQLLAFGKAHYPKFYWIFRGVGIGLILIGMMMTIMFMIFAVAFKDPEYDSGVEWIFYGYAIPFAIIGIVGAVLLCISFKKVPDENYIKHAIDYYTKADANAKAREARLQRNQANATRKEENKDISQLLKYKELLDAGIITQEEFDAKKKELL